MSKTKSSVPHDMTLLEALKLLAPDSTITTLRSWIKQSRIEVDKKIVVKASQPVSQGQIVEILPKSKFIDGGIKVIYEDTFIVVLEKEEGMLSVKSNFEEKETVHSYMKQAYGGHRVKVVHRLDQGTSGVILFALEERAYQTLKKTFEKHDLVRSYTAVVEGYPKPPRGTWESYLYEDDKYVVHSTKDETKGKLATTHYKTLATHKHYALIECTLETGKKNQIRVHAADAGHPLAGDGKYGAETNPFKRLALHAHLLEFEHPVTKKLMRFESKIPESFTKMFTRV
jgi:tRNA pseudouridine32 synthase/23S rRNA pseudouridine746 synthase/23S rRNA pseudouridine1911/1915/1917 synthase